MKAGISRCAVAALSVALGLGMGACTETLDERTAVGGIARELRPLTREEALADFDVMADAFRTLYGPMQRKEERYGFSFEEHLHNSREQLAQQASEPDYIRAFALFIARFKDAHVSLSGALAPEERASFSLPFNVMPVEDTFVVYRVMPGDDEHAPLQRGDELLSLDGHSPASIAERFMPLIGVPNEQTARHIAANYLTRRSALISQGICQGDSVRARVRAPSGEEREVELDWVQVPNPLERTAKTPASVKRGAANVLARTVAETTNTELAAWGSPVPFFYTPEARERFSMSEPIFPSQGALSDFGVSAEALTEIQYFAVKYSYQGKRILLLRLPDYSDSPKASTDQRLNYLRALLHEQQPTSDALVFDDTHNPGGTVELAQGVPALLAPAAINGFVQAMHADRLWIRAFLETADELSQDPNASEQDLAAAQQAIESARLIDELYSAGKSLSAPIGFPGIPTQPEDRVHWTKPRIVLTDELSASGGDLAPLLVKVNQLAPLFGQTTAGAGGNVQTVALLPNSAIELNLTRGSFTAFDPTGAYPGRDFVEDQGVTPDIEYSHTLQDFRAGYVGYVEAFSAALLKHAD